MSAFMSALPENCKLLLLGDQYQLPSVDSGAVLADLMPPIDSEPTYTAEFAEALAERAIPEPMDKLTIETKKSILNRLTRSITPTPGAMTNRVTVLEVSKRFQKDIAELSEHVRRMDAAKVAEFLSTRRVTGPEAAKLSETEGVALIPSDCDWRRVMSNWVECNLSRPAAAPTYKELVRDAEKNLNDAPGEEPPANHECFKRLFARIAASRVLCLTHAGKFGVAFLNALIGDIIASDLNETINNDIFSGVFVMVLKNNRGLNLYNGDLGVLLRHPGTGRLRAVFESGDHFTTYAPNLIPSFKPAFAMTVHKSQGSEFDRVLMPLPENPNHRLATREVLYTGLTRAKKAAFIVASNVTLEAAVSRKTERHSGLSVHQ
jgi:exodeoxyribonuclease V alpha subunit